MATKVKDGAHGKKKGFSSLAPPQIAVPHGRRTPNSSLTSSPDKDFLVQSDKPIPHYLKPTISSGLEVCKQWKKLVPEDTTPKHCRRKSLDKPPSPSQVQRTPPSIIGPRERTLKPSLSFPRSANSPKPISDRTSKTPRCGKTQPLLTNARTIKKKNTNTTTKKEPKATDTPETSSSVDITEPIYIKAEQEEVDQESSVQEEAKEDITKVESEEILVEILPAIDLVVSESENPEYEKHILCNPSTFSEDEEAAIAFQVEDEKEKRIEKPDNNTQEADEEHGTETDEENNESRDCPKHPEESLADETDTIEEEGVTKNHNIDKGNGVSAEDSGEDHQNSSTMLGEKEDSEGGRQRLKFKERVDLEGIEETKSEAENVVLKRQGVQGKKEATAYNDVIEETASKLVEKRKSKVKALVGAFETVISLQEPEGQQSQQNCGNEDGNAVTDSTSSSSSS